MSRSSLDTGVLYCDDNLERLAALPSESVDLIYLDPPFFSNRVYEVIWGDEAEVRSFEDRWEGGIQHYVGWMRERVEEMRRVIKRTGTLYLHCDPHASHYLKVMLDEVFGPSLFLSEVIWKRTGAHNSARRWGPVHDVILVYAAGRGFTWNPSHQPYDPAYIADRYDKQDERGLFMDVSLTGPGRRQGDSGLPWHGVDPTAVGRHWQPSSTAYEVYEQVTGENIAHLSMQERLDRFNKAGLIFWPERGKVPRFKQHLHAMNGVPIQDVITDINVIGSKAAERLGYPTQKPLALLRRIIGASSNPGDVVLDPFCGCGTSIAAAHELKREWIGIDISVTAMNVMSDRFWREARLRPNIEGMPNTEDKLRQLHHFEFQNWVIKSINGTHSSRKTGDMGIDGYWWFTMEPVQVKQSDHVGRNVVDNFETAIRREGHDSGYIVAFSFTKGAREEVARVKREDGLNIRLVTVKEVLLMKQRSAMSRNLGPQPSESDVIPMETRKQSDKPTAEELIARVRTAETA